MRLTALNVLIVMSVTVIVLSLTTEARKCRKGNPESDEKGKKCNNKKGDRYRSSKSKRKQRVAPYWKKKPSTKDRTAREGDRVIFSCVIKGNPKPKFTWLRNGKLLTSENSKKIRTRGNRLIIPSVYVADMGSYTCQAKNRLGSLNYTFYLRILENIGFRSLEVLERPENQTSHVGDTAIFLCRSEDYPKPDVYWTRRIKGSGIEQTIKSSIPNPDKSVLVLHNVTKDDTGVYTCYIGNNKMHMQLSATLTVIKEGERLPYEPPCSLHIRREMLVDHKHGCKSSEPVEMHYCMGSCGRSYYIPQMVTDDADIGTHLNQTCSCCVGVVESLRIVELSCSLGQTRKGFYTMLRGCQCKPCTVEDELSTTTLTPTITKTTSTTTTPKTATANNNSARTP